MSQITPGSVTSSTQGFLTAVIANSALLFVEVGLFLVLKQRLQRIYSPRTYLPPPDKRSTKLPPGPWKWLPALLDSRAEDIIDKNGLDAYMFLRFLKMLVWIFLVFTVLTFAVIVPVDMIGQNGATSYLEKISWINVIDPQEQKRFTAHIVVVYILTIFVIYLIRREMSYFVLMRQRFLLSPSHSRLAQARTVLITSVPDTLSTESSLRQFASFVPGGVERVWLYRDTKRLNKVFNNREKTCLMLEKAVSEVLRNAVRVWQKKKATRKKKRKRAIPKAGEDEESRTNSEEISSDDEELLEHDPSLQLLDELVPHEKRPKHRTGALGVLGKKVDTIEWCRVSHILAQCVSYHQVLQMNDKFIETHPDDIVWHNLDDDALKTRSKVSLSWLATTALIVLWSFPVAAIGGLSNIYAVCRKAEWLGWICRAPAPLPSIIQGFLPPALLATLFAMMPFILQGLAWYEGLPRHSLISVSLYRRFFLFLLIHGFLIVTLSSGLTKVTQGLAGAGSALAQLFPLVVYYFGKWFLGRTPRQAFNVTFLMPSADFGTLLPRLSLLATIGLAYSVLNPLINLLASICFGCYYIAWKFLFLQVFDQPTARESGGGYFPMATSNLFVGLYIEQICLACLFFMKVSIADSRYFALAQGVLMLVLVVITIWAHVLLNRSFASLTQYLPMSLATKNLADRFGQDGEVDLFSKDFIQNLRKRMGKQPDRKQFDTFATRIGNDFDFSTSSGGDLEAGNNNSYVTSTTAPNTTTAQSTSDNDSTASRRSEALPTNVNQAESQGDNSPESSEDSLDEHAFDHPSTYVAQPCVWIPRDPLGLSTVLVEYLEEAGVRASDEGAIMDAKGVVMVIKPPPESTSIS
ncbi:DUF221 family protein [Lentinula novae-zelandiae]|nr:DUF221 family protein [Lentinula novae-zelandiae]